MRHAQVCVGRCEVSVWVSVCVCACVPECVCVYVCMSVYVSVPCCNVQMPEVGYIDHDVCTWQSEWLK